MKKTHNGPRCYVLAEGARLQSVGRLSARQATNTSKQKYASSFVNATSPAEINQVQLHVQRHDLRYEFPASALAMLRAASPATLAVPRLLRSIASCAWPERSIARAGAARTIASLLPCCWQMLRCSDQMQQQAHCKMGMAARERAQASFQVLKIISVNGSRRGALDCFLGGIECNLIQFITWQKMCCWPSRSTKSRSRCTSGTSADAACHAASEEPSTTSRRQGFAEHAAADGGRS